MTAPISLNYAPAPGAPLPLSRVLAIRRAAELKRKGLPWGSVAIVLAEYHGHYLHPQTWRAGAIKLGYDVPRLTITPAKQRQLTELQQLNRDRARSNREVVDGVAA